MNEWKVVSNFIGMMVYQVCRIIDEKKTVCTNNMEYQKGIFSTKEEAQRLANELNKVSA